MNTLIVFAAVLAVSSAQFLAPVATKSQYHAQDEFGQSSFGYSFPGQAHSEARDAAGNVRGSYAYVDPTGKEIRVNYVAGHGGFRAESNALPVAPGPIPHAPAATTAHVAAVPVAPVHHAVAPIAPVHHQIALAHGQPAPVHDTPEVIQAKAAHFAAYNAAAARNGHHVPLAYAAAPIHHGFALAPGQPAPVLDTPEVAAAKAAHFSAVNAALARNSHHLAKRQAVFAYNGLHPYSYATNYATSYAHPFAYSTLAAPALTYSTAHHVPAAVVAPAVHHPVAYTTATLAHPLREATLTRVVNTPGHAVSYRVD